MKHLPLLSPLLGLSLLIVMALSSCQNNPASTDSIVPTLTWLSYPSAPWLGEVTVAFKVESESPLAVVNLLPDVSTTPLASMASPTRGETLSFTVNTDSLADGFHLLTLQAVDSSGNSGKSDPLPVEIRNADTTPPVVEWLYQETASDLTGLVGLPFTVSDNRGVRSVRVYRNGTSAPADILDGTSGNRVYPWNSATVPDGYYTFEVDAIDSSGNIGHSRTLLTRVVNQALPRIITIPTDYATIQAGINASKSGDTLRVLPGTYNEGLNFFGKDVWFESTDGPEVTILDATGWAYGILIENGEDSTCVIRGITITNAVAGGIGAGSSLSIYNSIIKNNGDNGMIISGDQVIICNCIVDDNRDGIQMPYNWGRLINTIIVNSSSYGLWNAAIYPNPIYADYNLYDNNQNNFGGGVQILTSDNDLFESPGFLSGSYGLSDSSVCIDSGDPAIHDIDGSRSDRGVYGGPYAYQLPNR